jgi:hypothetical protein
MKRAACHQAINRRILSAFYTQYVAVLLIVLVMSVSMYSTRDREVDSNQTPAPKEVSRFVGSKVLAIPFSESGEGLAHTAELEAIASALQAHDLRATFRLAAHSNGGNDLREALHKLQLIRVFMEQRGVPTYAVRTILSDSEPPLSVAFDLEDVPYGF